MEEEKMDSSDFLNLKEVLKVSVQANPDLYRDLMEEDEENRQILQSVFKPEYDFAIAQARAKGWAEGWAEARGEDREKSQVEIVAEKIECNIHATIIVLQQYSLSREEAVAELMKMPHMNLRAAKAKVAFYWRDTAPENK